MSELDIVRFHTGLEQDYGLEATYLDAVSSTTLTTLLTPDGLPLSVGWFDNSWRIPPYPSLHALKTLASRPHSVYHHVVLGQLQDGLNAILVESDSTLLSKGYASHPQEISKETLEQPVFGEVLKTMVRGAFVINTTLGNSDVLFGLAHESDIDALREYGQEIIRSGNVLAIIDNEALDRYEASEPPIFH